MLLLLCECLNLFDLLLLLCEAKEDDLEEEEEDDLCLLLFFLLCFFRLISPTSPSLKCVPVCGLTSITRRIYNDTWIQRLT